MSYSDSDPVTNSPELKLYQFLIFSIPICFTFIILFFFYLFYLRRPTSSDFPSLGIPITSSLSTAELGLRKELREMLPILVFQQSFSVMDSQCSVCLGDYESDEKLQQIPLCGHSFHMHCIDLWLTSHSTCPLCRLPLIPTLSNQRPVPSLLSSDAGQHESQPLSQQEQQRNPNDCDRERDVFEKVQEEEKKSIGTSNTC